MMSRQPLGTTVFVLLACWPAANGLLAQDMEKDRESLFATAVRTAVERLKVPPEGLRVVQEAQVGDMLRLKVVDFQGGRIEVVDLDASHREMSREKVEALLAAQWNADFQGKLENDLVAKLHERAATGSTGSIEVLVWTKTTEPPILIERNGTGAAAGSSADAVSALQTHHLEATAGLRNLAESRDWKIEYQAQYAPVIVMEIPNDQLETLQARPDVDAIYLARVYEHELNNSVPSIGALTLHKDRLISGSKVPGITGRNVTVAVVEGGAIDFDHDFLADGSYCNDPPKSVDPHTTGVAGVIASTDSRFKGVAPDVSLLSGNVKDILNDAEVIACTEWAIKNGARVINYSFGTDSTSSLAGLDRYGDYVARHSALTMVKAAGNKRQTCNCPEYFVSTPGKGWNTITVGNYNDGGTDDFNCDDAMHIDPNLGSCFGDPASPHKDREKPELAAPGTAITTTSGCGTCFASKTGTSLAAPHVAGCAALLMERDNDLKYWPEAIKAILMASAVVNLEGDARLSEHDGAGGIRCDSADEIVRGVGGGEEHGIVRAADAPTYTLTATAGKTVRVVIAWDSSPNAPVGSMSPTTDILKTDFDLEIDGPGPKRVAGSYSWDNSYEIVEFTAPVTGTYTARVVKYRTRNPFEYLGFAWWSGVREK